MIPTVSPHEVFRRTKHFQSLDGVRCVCILGVIWHHCPHPAAGPRFLEMGYLGVDMFFVLSGFLIVTLLRRERARCGDINLRNFYVRRTLRIFPIYYLLLLAVAIATAFAGPGSATARSFWGDLPYLATYTANWVTIATGNFGIFWSLATEEQFYLLWPGLERSLRASALLVAGAALLAVNQLLNFGALDPLLARLFGAPFLDLPIVQATFTPILLGVLLAHLLDRRGTYDLAYRGLGHRWSPLAPAAALLLLCEFAPGDISGLPRLAIQCAMTLLLGSLVIREDHVARRWLSFPPVARLGMISYGVYLYHMWGIHLVGVGSRKLGLRDPYPSLTFVAAVLTSALIAELSFRLIESPILKWKARFGDARPAQPQAQPAILEVPEGSLVNPAAG